MIFIFETKHTHYVSTFSILSKNNDLTALPQAFITFKLIQMFFAINININVIIIFVIDNELNITNA